MFLSFRTATVAGKGKMKTGRSEERVARRGRVKEDSEDVEIHELGSGKNRWKQTGRG